LRICWDGHRLLPGASRAWVEIRLIFDQKIGVLIIPVRIFRLRSVVYRSHRSRREGLFGLRTPDQQFQISAITADPSAIVEGNFSHRTPGAGRAEPGKLPAMLLHAAAQKAQPAWEAVGFTSGMNPLWMSSTLEFRRVS